MSKEQEITDQKDEAQKIWDQLDAEDAGHAQPATDGHDETPASSEVPADDGHQAPAGESADATNGGDAEVNAHEQMLLDKINGLESMLGQVTQRLRNAEGHIGGLGSQLKQQQQVAQQVEAKGGEAPSAGEIRAAQNNPRAMAQLKEDYPEFADAMESALNERIGALEQQLRQQPVQNQGVSHEEMQRMRSEMAVEMRHPGWQDRVRTGEFMGWLQRQPREVQMLAESESPQDAVRLLDLHSDAVKSATSTRNQRLSSAAAIPSGRSGSSTRSKAVEDMSPAEYWAYLDQLDKQKA